MSESEIGTVQGLEVVAAGGHAVGDHPAGATVLQLDDASDFAEVEGTALAGGNVVAIRSADHHTNTLTLMAGLPAPLEDGDLVAVDPPSLTTYAQVVVDFEEGALLAEVPFGMKAFAGITAGDLVRFVEDSESTGSLRLVEVLGADPMVLADRIPNADELVLQERQATLGAALAAADLERAAARDDLDAAQAELARAFGEIDLLPDAAYVAAADQQVRDAAALDAKTKADAAEAAAKAYTVTMTNGLSKAVESTVPPGTTVLPKDSVWRQVDGAGAYLAVWTQTASPSGSTWAPRTLRNEVIDGLDVGKLSASSALIKQAVLDKLVVQLATIIKADIGNLTVTDTTKLNTLVAKQIGADVGTYVEILAQKIIGGTFSASIGISSSGAIVCGDPDGARVEIVEDGVKVYVIAPNGQPMLATSLTSQDVAVSIMDPATAARLAGFDRLGNAAAKRLDVTEAVYVRGTPLLGQLGGGTQQGWVDLLPRGIVRSNASTLAASTKAAGTEAMYVKVAGDLKADRRYRIAARGRAQVGSTGGVLRMRIRNTAGNGTTAAPEPTITSNELDQSTTGGTYSGSIHMDGYCEVIFTPTVDAQHRFGITFQGLNGSTSAARFGRIYIEDMGPAVVEVGGDEDGISKILYQTTWRATASRVYDKNGATIPNTDGQVQTWYWRGDPIDYRSSAVVFTGGAVEADNASEYGRTMHTVGSTPGALVGATIHKTEVWIQNAVWYGGSEVAGLVLGNLGARALPSTKTIDGTVWTEGLPAGQGLWVTVPTSWFTNGANLGVTIGDKDSRALNGAGVLTDLASGTFHGIGDPGAMMVRHTYSR